MQRGLSPDCCLFLVDPRRSGSLRVRQDESIPARYSKSNQIKSSSAEARVDHPLEARLDRPHEHQTLLRFGSGQSESDLDSPAASQELRFAIAVLLLRVLPGSPLPRQP